MDKAELIRHEIEKRRDHNLAIGNPLFAAMAEEDIELLSFIDSLQEEPVSKDLGDYINDLSKQFPEVSFAKLSRISVKVAKWQKQQDQETIELAEDHAYFAGRTKTIEEIEITSEDFERWWCSYDKKVGKDKAKKLWDKLSNKDKKSCMEYTPAYVASTSEKRFRKNPETFLRNKSWNDEIIPHNNATNKPSLEQQRLDKLADILAG